MSHTPPDKRSLLQQEGSEISELSTANESQISTSSQPNGDDRMDNRYSFEFAPHDPPPILSIEHEPEYARGPERSDSKDSGLGISGRPMSIERVPVGGRTGFTPPTSSSPFLTPLTSARSSPQIPGSTKPLLPPRFPTQESRTIAFGSSLETMAEEDDISRMKTAAYDDREIGDGRQPVLDHINLNNGPVEGCPTKHDIHSSRASWISISILILSIYSTIFSGIWLVLAIAQPRYGRIIHSGAKLSPATASTVFALFAKTIELSFVTVFVTFLGQVLTRRSLVKTSRGVTIPELSMRTWVLQPGFMITHWQHVRHAVLSVVGAITLTAAFVAMFYTTASDALVSPHLKYGKWEDMQMYGLVKSSYANPTYITNSCQTPISLTVDPTYAGSTCLSLEHAGQSYHNSLEFLGQWAEINSGGIDAPTDLSQRPQPNAILFDNTTVVGSWVHTNESDMTAAYKKYNRVINNITMSMPHAGVFSAAHDQRNGILQPEDLAGLGEYSVRASVVSPTVNVLCANMNATELSPLIYVEWPNALTNDSLSVPGQKLAWSGFETDITNAFASSPYLNRTPVDDLFQWGSKYGRFPPVFQMFPIDYNSLTNITVASSDSNYLLIKAPTTSTTDYTLCQIRSFLSPSCSTQYNVSGTTGGNLQSHCEDPSDKLAYANSVPGAPTPLSLDYRNVASQWLTASSLNDGISNLNSSTARLLSQLIPNFQSWQTVKLPTLTPSIAETLAVMAGHTLLLSTKDASFYHYWNYTSNSLSQGIYQPFNASLASQQYTSGTTQAWQGMFYIVLLLVFATNVFCLVYFFLRSGLVTDYTEPQNLFALAVNSPPSQNLHGSCGAGPEGEQLNVDWHVQREERSGHFFIREGERGVRHRKQRDLGVEMHSPGGGKRERVRVDSYSRLSERHHSFL